MLIFMLVTDQNSGQKKAPINRGSLLCCLRKISFLKFQHDGFGYDLLQYR